MDHSHMDHSGMETEMGAFCNMNMLFTWNTKDLCIIFRWWHVRTTPGLLLSLLGVVALTAAYEAIRAASRRYECWIAERQAEVPKRFRANSKTSTTHVIRALLYALQTFYAFMLMLLFMSYNGYVMLSVGVGSFVGFLIFGADTSATKETACH